MFESVMNKPCTTQLNAMYATFREGGEYSPEQRELMRVVALEREANRQRKIVVAGRVYNNLCHASREVGLSPRCIDRYARSNKPEHATYQYRVTTTV
jgi:hypothetical protein